MDDIRFGVHPGVRMGAKMIAALSDKTGRNLEEWIDLLRSEGPGEEAARIAWLKSEHGLGTNYAGVLAEAADGRGRERWDPEAYLATAAGYVEAQYSGKKEHLRPIRDRLLELGVALGDDVSVCPTKTFVALYRRRVFAQIKATTQSRVDLGLALAETPGEIRLLDTGGAAKSDRITCRNALASVDEIDAEVQAWLRRAYEADS